MGTAARRAVLVALIAAAYAPWQTVRATAAPAAPRSSRITLHSLPTTHLRCRTHLPVVVVVHETACRHRLPPCSQAAALHLVVVAIDTANPIASALECDRAPAFDSRPLRASQMSALSWTSSLRAQRIMTSRQRMRCVGGTPPRGE